MTWLGNGRERDHLEEWKERINIKLAWCFTYFIQLYKMGDREINSCYNYYYLFRMLVSSKGYYSIMCVCVRACVY